MLIQVITSFSLFVSMTFFLPPLHLHFPSLFTIPLPSIHVDSFCSRHEDIIMPPVLRGVITPSKQRVATTVCTGMTLRAHFRRHVCKCSSSFREPETHTFLFPIKRSTYPSFLLFFSLTVACVLHAVFFFPPATLRLSLLLFYRSYHSPSLGLSIVF